MPVINMLGMQVGSEKTFGAGYNVLPIWKKRLDAKTLVTTPNSDVLYAMSYVDLAKDGPLVMEALPGCRASLTTIGSVPSRSMVASSLVTSVWLDRMVAGAAKCCYCRPAIRARCRKVISSTVQQPTTSLFSYAGSTRTRKNLTPAVEHLERTKIYPLNGEASAKPMKFPDASGVPVNMLPISDASAFDQLKLLLDREGSNLASPNGSATWRQSASSRGSRSHRMRTPGRSSIKPRRPGTQ